MNPIIDGELSVIAAYTLREAIEDGVLVEVFTDAWDDLTGGKPLVVTAAIHRDLPQRALVAIWDEFVTWNRTIRPTLPEEDQLFATQVEDQTVWVIEDGQAFTILYPEDY